MLYNSDADWVAPVGLGFARQLLRDGQPACKVNVNDSDHSYFGMWNDTPQKNRNYAWENFMNGNQVLFMDPYLVYYPRQRRNLCRLPSTGSAARRTRDGTISGTIWDISCDIRASWIWPTSLPSSSLSSTKFCLAQTPPAGAEYLVYAPAGGPFTVDLSAMPSSRTLAVEWFNPATGTTITQGPIAAGSSSQSFTPPFSGDAVLYLVDTAGHK